MTLSMRFDARIPAAEREALAALVGRHLTSITTDQWAVQLSTEAFDICIVPDEISTPDAMHEYADVTRPKTADPIDMMVEPIATDLGIITSVSILSTVVTFSPPRTGEPLKIAGATIPAGVEYGPLFSHPSRPPQVTRQQTLVDLDIPFEIQTNSNNQITIYTDGCGFFVYATVNETPISNEICHRTEIAA